MIQWHQAERQAELAEDHRDRSAAGGEGGWVGGEEGGGVTLTCSGLRASRPRCMLDDKRSHLLGHVKSHLCEARRDRVVTSSLHAVEFVASAVFSLTDSVRGQ